MSHRNFEDCNQSTKVIGDCVQIPLIEHGEEPQTNVKKQQLSNQELISYFGPWLEVPLQHNAC